MLVAYVYSALTISSITQDLSKLPIGKRRLYAGVYLQAAVLSQQFQHLVQLPVSLSQLKQLLLQAALNQQVHCLRLVIEKLVCDELTVVCTHVRERRRMRKDRKEGGKEGEREVPQEHT